MTPVLLFILICALAYAIASLHEDPRFHVYWERSCTGRQWKREFPSASKQDIREFLDVFIDAFCFSESRRLQFRPSDRVMDIYQTRHSFPHIGDDMEIESFLLGILRRYDVDVPCDGFERVTLGELFQMTR